MRRRPPAFVDESPRPAFARKAQFAPFEMQRAPEPEAAHTMTGAVAWRCGCGVSFLRDPITEPENGNGTSIPCVSEVITHPNHQFDKVIGSLGF